MKYVHIVETQLTSGGLSGKSVATVILDGGQIRVEGDSPVADQLRADPAVVLAGQTLMPSDGEAYLTALQGRFRSAYQSATGVQEGDKVEPYVMPPVQKAA